MADADLWRDRNKIFVAGIPPTADDDALYTKFRGFGEMFQSKVVYDGQTGKSKGFGFITFCEYVHALEAVSQMNQAKWGNRVLNVRFLEPKANKAGETGSGAAVARRPAKVFGPCPAGCTTIYVGNLAYDITEQVLRKVFEKCGDIRAVRFAEHMETKEFRGFGYVQFYDGPACERAVALDGMIVMGRPMNIDYGSRDEASEKAREELQKKLKKGVCHKFQAGECTRGDECKFAHVLKTQDPDALLLQGPPTTTTSSTVSASPPPAPMSVSEPTQADDDAPICQNFQKGKCKRGASCRFQHIGSAAAAPSASAPQEHAVVAALTPEPPVAQSESGDDETPICQNFQKGKCKRGASCRFRHVDATTTTISTPPVAAAVATIVHRDEVGGNDATPTCLNYQKGTCKRGASCRFRHVDADAVMGSDAASTSITVPINVRAKDDTTPVCQNYQKGTCKRGEGCRYRHEASTAAVVEEPCEALVDAVAAPDRVTSDVPACQNFQKGTCRRGASCRFRHETVDETSSPAPSSTLPAISVCKNFQRGRCTRGASCRFAHTAEAVGSASATATSGTEYQKRFQSVCYNWQNTQSCSRGDQCPFEHDGGRRADVTMGKEDVTEDTDEEAVEATKAPKKTKKEMKEKKRKARDSDDDHGVNDDDDDAAAAKHKKKHKKEKKQKKKSKAEDGM